MRMHPSLKRLIAGMVAAVVVWGAVSVCRAEEEISFSVTVDKEAVALTDRLVLSYTITGARNATEPQLPSLNGFKIVSSGTTSQFNFVQGRMFASRCFTYILIPQRVGKFTIEPARWEYDGRQYTTEPINVEVVADESAAGGRQARGGGYRGTQTAQAVTPQQAPQSHSGQQLDLGDRMFIQLKTDKEEVYLNEQVILVFRLYRRNLGLDDLQYTPPPTVGFIEESLGKQKETRELVNGVLYDVIELKTALFPASTGELTISPATLKCNILVRSQRQRASEEGFFGGLFDESMFGGDPFFDRVAKYPLELKSNPLTIRVRPLPSENKPADFHGAVGDYQMEAWAKPERLKVGEPVNLTMKVVGTGNVSGLPSPVVEDVEGFKSYDSESKVKLQERIDTIGGEKVFEKVLIPQKAGKLKIPGVKFSYFNPRVGRYESLSEGPFWLDVEESKEGRSSVVVTSKGETSAKEDVQILKRDILFINESVGNVHNTREDWEHRWYFWWTQLIPMLLLLGTVCYRWYFERIGSDVRVVRFRHASGRAREGLKQAQKILSEGKETGRFYQVLYRALSDYLCDHWNLPAGEITPSEVNSTLVPKGLDGTLAQKTCQLMERIDQGRFAAAAGSLEEKRTLLQETGLLIKELERGGR